MMAKDLPDIIYTKVADAPDGIEQWRLSWDGSKVVTYSEGKDEAGAQAQKDSEGADAKAADKTKMDAEAAAAKADA